MICIKSYIKLYPLNIYKERQNSTLGKVCKEVKKLLVSLGQKPQEVYSRFIYRDETPSTTIDCFLINHGFLLIAQYFCQ